MNISTENVYVLGNPPPNSHFFADVGSNQSRVHTKVVLQEVACQCTFVVVAMNEKGETLEPSHFEFLRISVEPSEWFEMTPTNIEGKTLFFGPEMKHVKELFVHYRPAFALWGDAVTLRFVLLEKGKAKVICNCPAVKVASCFPRKPLHRRVVELQGTHWRREELPSFPPETFEGMDLGELGELGELDFDPDVFMDEYSKEEIRELKLKVQQLEEQVKTLETRQVL